jgi:hypothetical protein
MRIAALPTHHSQVAAATSGVGCAPVVAAHTPNKAGQLAPAATHPKPPASGCTRPLRDFDARLLHLVGDHKPGVSRGSGLAANAAVDRKAPSASERQSASPVVAPAAAGHVDTTSEHLGAGDGGDSRAHQQQQVAPAQLELNEQVS